MATNTVDIVNTITEAQKKRGMSDGKFAELLRVSHATWSRIKNNGRNPGGKFLRAVARELPECRLDVLNYMSNGDRES